MPRRTRTRRPLGAARIPFAAVSAGALRTGALLATAALVGAAPAAPAAVPAAGAGGPDVAGRVVDLDGEPLAGATVELRARETVHAELSRRLAGEVPRPVAATTAGEDGRFRLAAPTAGMWVLSFAAPGFAAAELELTPLLADEELGDLALPPAEEVRVAVRDPAGRPVAGARVVGVEAGGPWRDPERGLWPVPVAARTGPDGGVAVSRARGATLHLAAGLPGDGFGRPVEGAGRTIALSLPATRPLAVRIEGSAGARVAGAVAAVEVGDLEVPLGASDAAGLLTVSRPLGRRTVVRVHAPDGGTAQAALPEPEPPLREEPAGPPTVTEPPPFPIRLEPATAVAGRTLAGTPDRTPVSGAWVWHAFDPARTVRSDDTGRFDLRAPTRGGVVRAAAAGYGTAWQRIPSEPGATVALLLPPGARLAGRVVDEDRRPVADVEVAAFDVPYGRRPPRARTDRAGRFDLLVSAGRSYTLRAERAGWAPAEVTGVAPAPGAEASELEVVLRRGRTGVGRVVDEADEPVAGAVVRLVPSVGTTSYRRRPLARSRNDGASGTTTADGTFRIADLTGGRYDLEVAAPGFAPAIVPGVEVPEGAGATDLGTVVLSPGLRIAGRIVDPEGRPVEGAGVTPRPAETFGLGFATRAGDRERVVSAADGGFEIVDLAAGRPVDLEVERTGYADNTVRGVSPPLAEPLRVVLRPTVTVRGEVVDPEGLPVEGALVTARTFRPEPGEMRAGRSGGGQARTGRDGAFEIADVEPGEVVLSASATGYRRTDLGALHVSAGRDREGVRIELERGAVVHGTVTGPDGQPVPQAWVQVEERTGPGSPYRPPAASTDGDGRYRLEGVELGRRTVGVFHSSHVRAARDLEVGLGDNRLDFRLERGATVAGRVLDEAGAPVAGVHVSLVTSESSWTSLGATTADDGRFELEGVDAGRYHARAEKEGYATYLSDAMIVSGPVDGLELRLARGAAIVGRVVGLEPDDLPAVQIHASSRDHRGSAVAAVDFEGRFRLEGILPGSWQVLAAKGEGGRVETEIVDVEPGVAEVPVTLDFTGGHTVEGEVLVGGEPLAGLWVTIVAPDRFRGGAATSDHRGRFRIEGLEPGEYELTVARLGTPLRHDETIRVDGDRFLTVELDPASLGGRVVDRRDGAPVAGASLELVPLDAAETMRSLSPRDRLVTGPDGAFFQPAVGPGSYELVVTADGFLAARRRIEVAPGDRLSDLEIELERSTAELELVVRSTTGGRFEYVGAAVLPAGAAGGTSPAASGAYPVGGDGRVRVPGLAPGTWKVVVAAPRHATATATAVLPGPPVLVTLSPGAVLEVEVPALREAPRSGELRLREATGEPFAFVDLAGRLHTAFPLRFGRFELPVPAGAWTIEVTTPDGRTWTAPVTLAAGGTETLVLE